MPVFQEMTREELEAQKARLLEEYAAFQAKGLKLDMSRGKPGADQLDLSMKMLDVLHSASDVKSENGVDCRNYGVLDGIPECKRLFAELMGVEPKNLIVGGNSSLNMMFDYVSQCMTHGAGSTPWCKLDQVKFACPVPGYDRHFGVCEYFGIEMINIPMLEDGPDMELLEEVVKDPAVKGMFCVPKYSNPEGKTYSDEVVRRMAAMKTGAEDFRIIWDNAYCVHDLTDTPDEVLNMLDECAKAGNPDRVIMVASTSKISFPGAGVAVMAASDANIAMIKTRMASQTIGYDKLNQLRHVRFFKDADGIRAQMKRHAEILRPKFQAVLDAFEKELGGKGVASWKNPNGGYFISLDVLDGCAKRVGTLCKEAGVTLTTPGATYPYGKDPADRNIRIAPTLPPVAELEQAVALLCVCVQLAACEKLLESK